MLKYDLEFAGLDEAGRGCWAGPLCVAVVKLDKLIDGLADSKTLSEKKRLILREEIISKALAIGVGLASSQEIDSLGLTKALKLAAKRAFQDSSLRANQPIIVDGNLNFLDQLPNSQTLIKADQQVASVSAASIIAKTTRDQIMLDYDKQFPEYNFAKHKGYGTKIHQQAIELHGICKLHRLSFKPITKLRQQ